MLADSDALVDADSDADLPAMCLLTQGINVLIQRRLCDSEALVEN